MRIRFATNVLFADSHFSISQPFLEMTQHYNSPTPKQTQATTNDPITDL